MVPRELIADLEDDEPSLIFCGMLHYNDAEKCNRMQRICENCLVGLSTERLVGCIFVIPFK